MKPALDAPPDDQALLAAFVRGDRDALGQLAARHERPLLGLALGLLGNRALASEAVQDAWVRVIRSAATFSGRSSVRTWLYRIVINQSRDIAARQRRWGSFTSSLGLPGNSADVRDDPEIPAMRARLRAALDAMKPDDREAVLMRYHAGMTDQLAAEVLQIPLGTFKTRVRRAMTRLRAELNEGDER